MDLYQQAQALVDDNRLTAVISAVVTMLSLLPKLLSESHRGSRRLFG